MGSHFFDYLQGLVFGALVLALALYIGSEFMADYDEMLAYDRTQQDKMPMPPIRSDAVPGE